MLEVSEFLKVSDLHTLALYRRGNSEGEKFIYCHGGPGGQISEKAFAFFDLFKYDVVAFDQRGCGKSTPFAALEENDINYLVSDLEKIRQHYGFEKINLFGGSFGTTLALAYAIKYPQHVKSIILRGVFLGRDSDIKWLYQQGASYFYPENFERYRNFLPASKHADIVSGYYEIFSGNDEELIKKAALYWANWEMGLVSLFARSVNFEKEVSDKDISLAKLECHYFANNLGWQDDNYILNNISQLKNHKVVIVHGRYDVDCRLSGAFELAKHLDNSLLLVPIAGHGANDLDYNQTLIKAVNLVLDVEKLVKHYVTHDYFSANSKLEELKMENLSAGVNDGLILIDQASGQQACFKVTSVENGVYHLKALNFISY